jgi:hypothetical protein
MSWLSGEAARKTPPQPSHATAIRVKRILHPPQERGFGREDKRFLKIVPPRIADDANTKIASRESLIDAQAGESPKANLFNMAGSG